MAVKVLNKVLLISNLGKDPEVQTLEGNIKVAKFTCETIQKTQCAFCIVFNMPPTRNMLIYRIIKEYLHLVLDNSTLWVIFVSAFKTYVYYYGGGHAIVTL